MSGRPAATLLHLGPGLANGLANFHNARKAFSPVVNIVGQHTTQHLRHDAPLSADIEAFAGTVSGWVRTLGCAGEMGAFAAQAVRAAWGPPGQVASLIVPADFSWSEAGSPAAASPLPARPAADPAVLREAACVLGSGAPTGLLLGGQALLARGLDAAARLAAAGVRVSASRYAARLECRAGGFTPPRLAYFPEAAEPMLAGLRHLFLVESLPPVSFFGYPGRRSLVSPEDCEIHVLAPIGADGPAALEELADALPTPAATASAPPPLASAAPSFLDAIGRALAELLPAGAILSDEMVSSSEPISRHLARAATHDLLPVTGGSIGQCLPVAIGAAIACPDRKVVALEADGSGMYTLQALWTMARERLDVLTVILANRRYRILDVEMARTGAGPAGPVADTMLDIGRPAIDWVKLAEGMGVPATRAETPGEFFAQLRDALARRGPALIEAVIE
jgi:acetolactate synthase-1/2/3 large subunit